MVASESRSQSVSPTDILNTDVKVTTSGRASLSSVSTSNDSVPNSGYSTPATSAVATPASAGTAIKSSNTRRGRRAATDLSDSLSKPTVTLATRARALRNSEYSMNPITKRKRGGSDEEDLDDDLDEDDTADAQLARALQDEEDALAAAASMVGNAADELTSSASTMRTAGLGGPNRRSTRGLVSTQDEEEEDIYGNDDLPLRASKKPKIELKSEGRNSVKYNKKDNDISELESELSDEDDAFEPSDSDYESDTPLWNKISKHTGTLSFEAAESESDMPLSKKLTKSNAKTTRNTSAGAGRANRRSINLADSASNSALTSLGSTPFALSEIEDPGLPTRSEADLESEFSELSELASESEDSSESDTLAAPVRRRHVPRMREEVISRRARNERKRLETHHPELTTMWKDLENLPKLQTVKGEQPKNISRELKPFQLEGVAWMRAMEETEWGGGLLGDEMGMGKTIQAVSLIMSDFPAKQPSLVLIPPVALMQWQQEIADYTDGTLKTFVFHGTNTKTKSMTVKELKGYDVILMSYNSLESMYRKQEKGFKRKDGIHKEKSVIHQIRFHRVILDEAHNIKVSCDFPSIPEQGKIANYHPATYLWMCQGLFCT